MIKAREKLAWALYRAERDTSHAAGLAEASALAGAYTLSGDGGETAGEAAHAANLAHEHLLVVIRELGWESAEALAREMENRVAGGEPDASP